MTEKIYSNLMHKYYTVDLTTKPVVNEPSYRAMVASINGHAVMQDDFFHSDFHRALSSMLVHVGWFLDGLHDITHYAQFPEIAAAMAAK